MTKLVREGSNKEIKIGAKLETYQEELVRVKAIRPDLNRVYVVGVDDFGEEIDVVLRQLYPGAIGAKFTDKVEKFADNEDRIRVDDSSRREFSSLVQFPAKLEK
jgi:hypothetical protein